MQPLGSFVLFSSPLPPLSPPLYLTMYLTYHLLHLPTTVLTHGAGKWNRKLSSRKNTYIHVIMSVSGTVCLDT
jgi:hypothetical protein